LWVWRNAVHLDAPFRNKLSASTPGTLCQRHQSEQFGLI
jgi:hypothetical protein